MSNRAGFLMIRVLGEFARRDREATIPEIARAIGETGQLVGTTVRRLARSGDVEEVGFERIRAKDSRTYKLSDAGRAYVVAIRDAVRDPLQALSDMMKAAYPDDAVRP